MPDGSVARCYAEDVAERRRSATFYPHGFSAHYWHPERLGQPLSLKKPAGIFIDAMADLFGHWVPDWQIQAVLDVCQRASWHTFFVLTKNAPRLREFQIPHNVWAGVSMPPTYMFGKQLNPAQRVKMLQVALRCLDEIDVTVRWLSAEPLSFDISALIEEANLQWVVIGAATSQRRTFQPKASDVDKLLKVCDLRKIPVFFKGNLRWYPWRENYPEVAPLRQSEPEAVQAALF
jgi:protein gp37